MGDQGGGYGADETPAVDVPHPNGLHSHPELLTRTLYVPNSSPQSESLSSQYRSPCLLDSICRMSERCRIALVSFGISNPRDVQQMPRVDAVALSEALCRVIEEFLLVTQEADALYDFRYSVSASPTPGALTPANNMSRSQLFVGAAAAPGPLSAQPSGTTESEVPHVPSNGQAQGPGLSRQNSASSSVWSLRVRPVMTHRKVVKARDNVGNRIVNDYTLLQEIGNGSFGSVMLASVGEESSFRAVKVIDKAKLRKINPLHNRNGGHDAVYREIAIMKKLRHKNVVSLFEVIDDPDDSKLYIVMQYVEQGSIRSMRDDGTCAPLSEDLVRNYMRQVVSGLRYMHLHGIIHRDIKPDNILLDNDRVLIADFGVSEIVTGLGIGGDLSVDCDIGVTNATKGTPAFFPPEIILCRDIDRPEAIDVWALGVTIYALLFGRVPFNGSTHRDLSNAVTSAPLTFPEHATDVQRALLTRMLDKNPQTRATLTEVKRHPFFELDPSACTSPTLQASLMSPTERVLVLTENEITGAITQLGDHPEMREIAEGRPFLLDEGIAFSLPPALATCAEPLAETRVFDTTPTTTDRPPGTDPPPASVTAPPEGTVFTPMGMPLSPIQVPAALLSPKSRAIVKRFVDSYRGFANSRSSSNLSAASTAGPPSPLAHTPGPSGVPGKAPWKDGKKRRPSSYNRTTVKDGR